MEAPDEPSELARPVPVQPVQRESRADQRFNNRGVPFRNGPCEPIWRMEPDGSATVRVSSGRVGSLPFRQHAYLNIPDAINQIHVRDDFRLDIGPGGRVLGGTYEAMPRGGH